MYVTIAGNTLKIEVWQKCYILNAALCFTKVENGAGTLKSLLDERQLLIWSAALIEAKGGLRGYVYSAGNYISVVFCEEQNGIAFVEGDTCVGHNCSCELLIEFDDKGEVKSVSLNERKGAFIALSQEQKPGGFMIESDVGYQLNFCSSGGSNTFEILSELLINNSRIQASVLPIQIWYDKNVRDTIFVYDMNRCLYLLARGLWNGDDIYCEALCYAVIDIPMGSLIAKGKYPSQKRIDMESLAEMIKKEDFWKAIKVFLNY